MSAETRTTAYLISRDYERGDLQHEDEFVDAPSYDHLQVAYEDLKALQHPQPQYAGARRMIEQDYTQNLLRYLRISTERRENDMGATEY